MACVEWGPDYLGIPSLKITKNNADIPLDTPDTDYSKFYFNSKWDMNVRFVGQERLTFVSGNYTSFVPSGTDKNSYKRGIVGQNLGFNMIFWKNSYWQDFGQLDYQLPLFDLKPIASNGWTSYCVIQKFLGTLDTRWYSAGGVFAGWAKNFRISNPGSYPINGATPANMLVGFDDDGSDFRSCQAIVYNLPGNEDPILYPATDPVPGQTVIEISSTGFRVAKPGYAVSDIAAKLAFDSSTRPAKIVASGDIALPSGVVTVFDFSDKLAGINVDAASIVVDVLQYKGSTITFPCTIPDDEDDWGAPYRVNGTTIEFNNAGSAIRARFIVIAQDNTPLSSGANDVLRQIKIGGVDVFQILRPGSADPPSLADVIIDTRWPCLQIIKTGVFDIPPSGGAAANTDIAFDSTGLFPFIKFHPILPAGYMPQGGGVAGSGDNAVDFLHDGMIRVPYASAGFVRNGSSGAKSSYINGETAICQLTPSRARFITYRGGPYRRSWNGSAIVTTSVRSPATKIRYYIFGIPA